MQALCFAFYVKYVFCTPLRMTLKGEANFKLDASNLAKYPLRVILSVVETRGGLRRDEDSEGESFCERLGSKKRLSIALLFICYILRAVCGDNIPLARLWFGRTQFSPTIEINVPPLWWCERLPPYNQN